MCCMCDGKTFDEVHDALDDTLDRFEWAVQGVEASRPWVYTVGLTERFGHAELVLAGIDLGVAAAALNSMGARIATGERFEAGQVGVVVGEVAVELGEVHPVHLANGLVGVWEAHYARRRGEPPPLELLQVLPVVGRRLPRLDRASTTLQI